jgi:hypothetical protein
MGRGELDVRTEMQLRYILAISLAVIALIFAFGFHTVDNAYWKQPIQILAPKEISGKVHWKIEDLSREAAHFDKEWYDILEPCPDNIIDLQVYRKYYTLYGHIIFMHQPGQFSVKLSVAFPKNGAFLGKVFNITESTSSISIE